jgi:hypothetical protein
MGERRRVRRALWGIERDAKIRSEAIFHDCQPRIRTQLEQYGGTRVPTSPRLGVEVVAPDELIW